TQYRDGVIAGYGKTEYCIWETDTWRQGWIVGASRLPGWVSRRCKFGADGIKDIGPQPQSFDIERATKENTNYRSVAWSGRYLQVTLMSIPAGGDIGL